LFVFRSRQCISHLSAARGCEMVRGTFALSYYSFLEFNFQQLTHLKLVLLSSPLLPISHRLSLFHPAPQLFCSTGMSDLHFSKILHSSFLILAPEIIAGLTALGVEFTKAELCDATHLVAKKFAYGE
jgi:hypothetical protein